MKYEGQAIQTAPLDGGFVELKFDLKGDSVNKFNALTMGELKEVVASFTNSLDQAVKTAATRRSGAPRSRRRPASRGTAGHRACDRQ